MGAIVTISSSKGGCGKTALAALLAISATNRGLTIACVDADPNAGLSRWMAEVYEGPSITCISEADLHRVAEQAQKLAETHDLVLVDTAGFSNQSALVAIGTADLVLIPCMADRGSIIEAHRTGQVVATMARGARRDILHRIVRSAWVRTGLAERATEAELLHLGLPLLPTVIPSTADMKKLSLSGGLPPTSALGHQAEQAINDIVQLGVIPGGRNDEVRREADQAVAVRTG